MRGARTALRLRRLVNLLTLATPAGLLVARVGGATPRPGPAGLVLAPGYRLPIPPAPAFTIGNVILVRAGREDLLHRPAVLRHEARHASQYACCAGLPMVPAYLLAAGWSWLRCGDVATYNIFERLAGLADGGYRPAAPRRPRRGRARGTGSG